MLLALLFVLSVFCVGGASASEAAPASGEITGFDHRGYRGRAVICSDLLANPAADPAVCRLALEKHINEFLEWYVSVFSEAEERDVELRPVECRKVRELLVKAADRDLLNVEDLWANFYSAHLGDREYVRSLTYFGLSLWADQSVSFLAGLDRAWEKCGDQFVYRFFGLLREMSSGQGFFSDWLVAKKFVEVLVKRRELLENPNRLIALVGSEAAEFLSFAFENFVSALLHCDVPSSDEVSGGDYAAFWKDATVITSALRSAAIQAIAGKGDSAVDVLLLLQQRRNKDAAFLGRLGSPGDVAEYLNDWASACEFLYQQECDSLLTTEEQRYYALEGRANAWGSGRAAGGSGAPLKRARAA